MNANPDHQRILLDVADLDRRLAQTEHARKHPEQAARISELAAQRNEQVRELTVATGARDDARSELARIESDVALAQQRKERNAQRLTSVTNPKDAVALEHEIVSIERRLHSLEDTQLDAMGALEETEARLAAQQALVDATTAEGQELTRQAKAAVAAAEKEADNIRRDREAITGGISPELLADYDRRATRGIGAALLRAGTCGGCHMMLSSTDMAQIRRLAADAIATCPECGCILVRTEESGL
ncbi:zinc ribbon domain-containing protein [Microbacterium sp. YY-01]|uniref:zinc ribbon domain-containing protein n=1 Tax=Microbacterium sp. YY-01 TaxID=3421634 RepID=UPI003D177885